MRRNFNKEGGPYPRISSVKLSPSSSSISSSISFLSSAKKAASSALRLAPGLSLVLALAVAYLLSGASSALAAVIISNPPEKTNYQNSPIMSTGRTIPRVLLVLSKDYKMFGQAYNELTDMDADGRVDTGFNPSVIYYGYFDPKGCYKYSHAHPANTAYNPDQYFDRVGDTIDDHSQAVLDSRRTSNGISTFVKAARAVHYQTGEKIGVCQLEYNASGSFSGNWLNFVTMTRMDVIRKILYGGSRRVDNATTTILQGSFTPADSNVWGSDVVADNRWSNDTPMTNYFEIHKFAPFAKPTAGTAHFFARVRNRGGNDNTNKPWPTLEYILNANVSNFNRSYVTPTGNGRHFDWILADAPNPSNQTLRNSSVIRHFNAMVKVCKPGNYGEMENCREYPNGALKPVGLLQKNGENDQMLFGLLTGTYDNTTRRNGGALRAHIRTLSSEVNPNTGVFLTGGVIGGMDALTIAGHGAWGSAHYTNSVAWGNPTGEMLFEATRYFMRLAKGTSGTTVTPTSSFLPTSEYDYTHVHHGGSAWRAQPIKTWVSLPVLPAADCAKPIILLIADIDPDYDGDTAINGSNDLKQQLLSQVSSAAASKLPAFNLASYLTNITSHEGYANGSKYFYAANGKDDCMAKTLNSIQDVKGFCPNSPGVEGTYSATAVAHYAHTHNFSTTENEQGIDVYAVTMSGAFPVLDFPVYNADGSVAKKIAVLPASMSDRDATTTKDRIIGFLNYYILDWQVDQRGTPYHVTIKVNYEDAAQGSDTGYGNSDWDMDILMEHTFDLVTVAGTSTAKRLTTRIPFGEKYSGALKLSSGSRDYYTFKTPNNGSFTIEPSEVVGLMISSWKSGNSSSINQAMGYTISGTTHDGTYMDYGHQAGVAKYATPPTCNWPAGYGSTTANGSGCKVRFGTSPGHGVPDPIGNKLWRTFEFTTNPEATGKYLPNSLYLAAKYGGFKDYDNNGFPDPGEWEKADGTPKNYFQATNISELPAQLEAAFRDIAKSISTGTATSASIDTILGGGVSVQTIYYPLYVNPNNSTQQLRWVGSLYGLFVDRWGNLREDNDGDGVLTIANGDSGSTGDYIVTFNSVKTDTPNPPACYSSGSFISRCFDAYGNNTQVMFTGSRGHPSNIHQIEPLFDTGSWLSKLNGANLLSGSRAENTPATIVAGKRRIFYGKPNPADPGRPTLSLFEATSAAVTELQKYMVHDNFVQQIPTAGTKYEATNSIVRWIIGEDQPGLRSRQVGNPWGDNATLITWRLGDIINSKPILLGAPISGFDILYGDTIGTGSYLKFKQDNSTRRQTAYFGGNDGMLHAVNVGFYGSLEQGQVSFTRTDPNGLSRKMHDVGAELWAYIPTSLLPHLQWLPDPEYNHSNYVDLKPLINDVKINGEWRTILIGGLRMAARPIEAPDSSAYGSSHYFSEIFCLDITDPEHDPKLLWRYSTMEQGLTVGLPQVISHVTRGSSAASWYVILPSGPVTDTPSYDSVGNPRVLFGSNSPYEGYSNQKARLIVLNAATGQEIVHSVPNPNYLTVSEENSFFNNPFLPRAQKTQNPWTNHTLYYGLTVSMNPVTCEDLGAVYRLKTVDSNGDGIDPSSWTLERLYQTDRPVTGAVNASYDSAGNLWVLFGTGRLWNANDVTPCSVVNTVVCKTNHDQYLFGIKEELNADGYMTFRDRTSDSTKILDVSGAKVFKEGGITGLRANASIPGASPALTTYSAVSRLLKTSSAVGYKRMLDMGNTFYPSQKHAYEMITTQPKIFTAGTGTSYVAFTSFEPKESGCGDFGYGFLYLLDTFTGLPDPATYNVYYSTSTPPATGIEANRVLGAIITGEGAPTEAFVITNASGITVSAAAPDASIHSMFLPMTEHVQNRLTAWKEVLDTGFSIPKDVMTRDLGL
jgi:type IV pilus assembly protein PilY1